MNVEHILDKLRLRDRGLLRKERYVKNAVLLPLIQTGDHLELLFQKRASTLRRQSGEVCFPGGRAERGDESEWHTAVRETSEELGISAESIQYLGDLDVMITHSQLIIYPFVALLTNPASINPNPDEVDEIFTVRLDRLLAMQPDVFEVAISVKPDDDFPYHLIPNGKDYNWRVGKIEELFYVVDGRVIWGMTAAILHHFLGIIHDPVRQQSLHE